MSGGNKILYDNMFARTPEQRAKDKAEIEAKKKEIVANRAEKSSTVPSGPSSSNDVSSTQTSSIPATPNRAVQWGPTTTRVSDSRTHPSSPALLSGPCSQMRELHSRRIASSSSGIASSSSSGIASSSSSAIGPPSLGLHHPSQTQDSQSFYSSKTRESLAEVSELKHELEIQKLKLLLENQNLQIKYLEENQRLITENVMLREKLNGNERIAKIQSIASSSSDLSSPAALSGESRHQSSESTLPICQSSNANKAPLSSQMRKPNPSIHQSSRASGAHSSSSSLLFPKNRVEDVSEEDEDDEEDEDEDDDEDEDYDSRSLKVKPRTLSLD